MDLEQKYIGIVWITEEMKFITNMMNPKLKFSVCPISKWAYQDNLGLKSRFHPDELRLSITINTTMNYYQQNEEIINSLQCRKPHLCWKQMGDRPEDECQFILLIDNSSLLKNRDKLLLILNNI